MVKKGAIPKQLIGKDLGSIPKERQREIASMGGKALKNNPNARMAGKLREMKKRGLTDERAQWCYEMLTDSDLASTHIVKVLNEILLESENSRDKAVASRLLMDWQKIRHGTAESNKKVSIEITHLSTEEKEAEIKRIIQLK